MIIKKGQPSLSHVPSLSQHSLFSLIYGGLNDPLDYVKFSHNFLNILVVDISIVVLSDVIQCIPSLFRNCSPPSSTFFILFARSPESPPFPPPPDTHFSLPHPILFRVCTWGVRVHSFFAPLLLHLRQSSSACQIAWPAPTRCLPSQGHRRQHHVRSINTA